ncbi:MAG: sensor histidine kinase [Geobacter sp.]|nr:sensor histidine kinase [Geobacter sp.]
MAEDSLTTQEDIKKQIAVAIENNDFDTLLRLSSELAKTDVAKVRFTIDASHVSRLGLELVAKQETAVAELVKNGYDADATHVDLIFRDTDYPGGTLEIIDNGLGMTRAQLINGFMRISTADKVENQKSIKYLRQKAGRKGIGRFAAQRLGTRLILTTQIKDSKEALRIVIDWDRFEANQDLNTISNLIEVIEKNTDQGTTLLIENLRDGWSDAQIKRAFRYVSDLLQPFPLEKALKDDINDPGFKAAFYRQVGDDIVAIADETTTFFEHALAVIDGWIDSNGHGYWSVQCKRYGIDQKNNKIGPDRHNPNKPYTNLPPINFKAYYFIPLPNLLPMTLLSAIRESLNTHGGIRLYRNGFRVLPYGEAYDDWLRLDKSYGLREILPPHSNKNFFGFLEVNDLDGKYFQETSSREGLVENNSFRDLQDFVSRALKSAVLPIAEARDRKTLASAPSPRKKGERSPEDKASTIAQKLRSAASSQENRGNATFNAVADELEEEILELGQSSQKMLEENGMLRVLASLGLTIGEFTHEIRHSLGAMVANLTLLTTRIAENTLAMEPCEGLMTNLDSLQSYARYFDDAVTDNAHRRLQPLELRDIISSFKKIVNHSLQRDQVELTEDIQGYDLFTRPMHKSEWASVLLNLFTNSIKAIRRAQVDGKILIRAGEEDSKLFLEFSDNGDGVLLENQERIFDAFFTTSTPPGPLAGESEELTGTGLGLKIVKDIIDAAEGEIFLVTPPQGFSTCFRIVLPRASEEEIPDDAY